MRQPLFILFLQIRRAIDDDAARLFHDCEISLCRRQGFFQSLAVPFFDAHLGTADLFRRSRLFLSIFRQKVTDVDVFTIFDFDGYRHGPAVLEDDLVAAIVEDADRVALRIGVAPFVFPIGLGIADGRQVGDRRWYRSGSSCPGPAWFLPAVAAGSGSAVSAAANWSAMPAYIRQLPG